MSLPASIKFGMDNLRKLYAEADTLDMRDGMSAYINYHGMMQRIAFRYGQPFPHVVAAFAALSPNNDYVGNLRSLLSVLEGFTKGVSVERVTVSTYKACRDRAWSYLMGDADFLKTVKGPKITAFYHNILDPTFWGPVTVDGHMVGAFVNQALTMKDASHWLTRTRYRDIAIAIQELAHEHRMLPHQMQAVLWFTRKRVLRVKYTEQLDTFGPIGEGQRVTFDLQHIQPFPVRPA